jgi:CIC family chloride channel protein
MNAADKQTTARSSRPTYLSLNWVPEFILLGRRRLTGQIRVMGLAVLVGVVAGVGAIAFYGLSRIVEHYALAEIVGYRPAVHPAGEVELSWLPKSAASFRPWLLLLVPTVGGLISGFIVYTFAPEAEGHGTDAVISAYHTKQGQIRPRVPLVKIVTSAVTIGTGGSGGREGPIAQIGAGFGSLLANVLSLRPAERRVLMAAGMGAGIAAIFRAPLAGALFAAEVLYWSPEFEPEVIIPAGLASVVSYCTFGVFSGWDSLFAVPTLTFNNPWQLGPYALLAFWVIFLAALYTRTFYGFTRLFHRWRVPPHFKPAVGALATGAVGLALYFGFGRNSSVLAVLSFGYGSVQEALNDSRLVGAALLAAIAFGKILTTSLTIGSGGSGGVFGPSVVIGGCGGGALGLLISQWWPGLGINPASFVVVGMAGFFAAAAKTPFSTIVIVSEMTGGYLLLLPTLWVCMIAFMLSDERSIYSAQVEGRSRSPAHHGSFLRDRLAGAKVNRLFQAPNSAPTLTRHDSLASIIGKLRDTTYPVLPVVDGDGLLVGVVNLEEVYMAVQLDSVRHTVLAEDLIRTDITPLSPEDPLDRAQELFVENDLLALPVVNNLQERRLLGMIRRFDISSAYLRCLQGAEMASE